MIRAVLDTNIIISAIFWAGKPYNVVSRGLKGDYVPITSPEIIDEVSNKLRNKFHFPEYEIEEQVNLMLGLFHVIQTVSSIDVVRDKSDNKIIECAIDGKADHIVTGDPDLLSIKEFKGIKILTADQFLKAIK